MTLILRISWDPHEEMVGEATFVIDDLASPQRECPRPGPGAVGLGTATPVAKECTHLASDRKVLSWLPPTE